MRDALVVATVIAALVAALMLAAVACSQPPGPNPRQAHHAYEPFTIEVAVRDR